MRYTANIHSSNRSEMIAQEQKSLSINFSIDKIKSTVCRHLKIDVNKLMIRTRKPEIVEARQICMFFAIENKKKLNNISLQKIASEIGGLNHATCIYSAEKVNNYIDIYPDFDKKISEIRSKLN